MKSSELAERIGAVHHGEPVELTGVASFGSAGATSVVFVQEARYLEMALASAAGAVIVPEKLATEAASPEADNAASPLPAKVWLRSSNPRLAFALAAATLGAGDPSAGGVHPSAVVDPTAVLDPTAQVEALAVIGGRATIGRLSRIGAGAVIGEGVKIGEGCRLEPRVVVHPGTTLGNRVVVKAGAVLGGEGFGFVPDPATGRYHKFPQIGRLEIGDDVEIGALTCVDRGALDATVLADGAKLDNLIQVGHNVHIGRNTVIASQTGISGSTVLEDNVIVGGQVGMGDHARVEEGAILGAGSGVLSNKVVRGKGVVFWGTPARPLGQYLRELATLARLGRKKK